MDTDKVKIPAPIDTSKDAGVSVHLQYIRRDIDEIKLNMNNGFERLENLYVTRIDFDEHTKKLDDHESRLRLINQMAESTSKTNIINPTAMGADSVQRTYMRIL